MGRPEKFRPPNYPIPTPWWYSAFVDPYERVNVWSHGFPGTLFLLFGFLARLGFVFGGNTMTVFCSCAATTHLLSAITHAFPEDMLLEKMDHVGIVALVAGTPITAIMAKDPTASLVTMWCCIALLVAAAFLPPLMRTLAFIAIGTLEVLQYWFILTPNLGLQVLLYCCGAYAFIRNGGHTRRLSWLTDHHLLHYLVTAACCLHVHYITAALTSRASPTLT